MWPAPHSERGPDAVNRFIAALSFLTQLPVPQREWREGDFEGAVPLYPFAGLVIGLCVAGAGWVGAQVDPWIGALAALTVWVGVTGALHLDGLGDVADGLGAAHGNRERLLSVMADPHIGSFGVVAIVLLLAAKLVLLHLLLPNGWVAIITVPAAARVGPLVWARFLPCLKPEGLGAAIAGATEPLHLIGWGLVLAAASLFLPVLLITPLLILGCGAWFRGRLGGMTGDAHGAGIEIVETALLLAFVVL